MDGSIVEVFEKIGFDVNAFKMAFRRSYFSLPQRNIVKGVSLGSFGMRRLLGAVMLEALRVHGIDYSKYSGMNIVII